MSSACVACKTHENLSLTTGLVALAALVAQAWDILIYFSDEVEHMWRGKVNRVKILYFLSRYLLLFFNVLYFWLIFRVEHGILKMSPMYPKIYIFRTIAAQTAETLLEAILHIRVYALYNKGYKAKIFLLTLFSISTGIELIGCAYLLRAFLAVAGCPCPVPDKTGIAYVASGTGLSHFVIFVMTMAILLGGGWYGWQRTPLTSLMLREGVVAFSLVILALTAEFVLEYLNVAGLADKQAVTWMWFIVIASVTSSRLILNMRKLYMSSYNGHDEEVASNTNHWSTTDTTSMCLTTMLSTDQL